MKYLDYTARAQEKETARRVAVVMRVVRPDRELGDAWLARIAKCSLVLLSVTTCLLAARVVSRQVSAQASLSALQPGGEEQVGAHWAELLQVSHTSTLQCNNQVNQVLD